MVEGIVNRLYQQFAIYDAHLPLDVCTHCCMFPEDVTLLANCPVRSIPKALLQEYVNGASSHKTPTDELKHFLPKWFELIANFDFPSFAVEITIQRFATISKEEWTDTEFQLVNEFLREFFIQCLLLYPLPNQVGIDEILIMFWKGNFDIVPILDLWSCGTTTESILHYKDLVLYGFKANKNCKMTNSFAPADLSLLLWEWVYSSEVKRHFAEMIENVVLADAPLDNYETAELEWVYTIIT